MKRFALLFAMFGCSSPTAPRSVPPLHRPAFAVDESAPATPTNITAAVVEQLDAQRVVVRIQWTDNTTATDEFNTCATAVAADGAPMGGGCVYASEYDAPAGSTGIRSGTVIVGVNAATVTLLTWRRFLQDDGWWRNIASAESETVAVTPFVTLTTTKKGKR